MEYGLAARSIKELTYDRIIDAEESASKTTVQFIANNYDKLLRYVMKAERLHQDEAEIILSNLYFEMEQKTEDYQIYVDEETGRTIPLEAYIKKMLSIHAKRYFSNRKKKIDNEFSCNVLVNTKDSDGSSESLFDFMVDDKYVDPMGEVEYDLETAINNIRHLRYALGYDIFSVLYGRLVSTSNITWNEYLESLEISKEDLCNFEYKCVHNEDFIYLITAMAYKIEENREEGIRKLEKYVYCAKTIKNALSC